MKTFLSLVASIFKKPAQTARRGKPIDADAAKEMGAMYLGGASVLDIAAVFNKQPATVRRHLVESGIQIRRPGPRGKQLISRRNAEIVQAYTSGKTLLEVAGEHGITRERVRQILVRAGVRERHRGVEERDARHAAMATAYINGATIEDLARAFGLSLGTVTAIVRGHPLSSDFYKKNSTRGARTRSLAPAMAEAYRLGATIHEIAERFDFSPMTVHRALRLQGIGRRKSGRRKSA